MAADFVVDAFDDAPGGVGAVVRVFALYRVPTAGSQEDVWSRVELTNQGAGRWIGRAEVPAGTESLDYFAQAVDLAGNVAITTNKGVYHVADDQPPPTSACFATELSGVILPNGRYQYQATVGVAGELGVRYFISVDGGELCLTPGQ